MPAKKEPVIIITGAANPGEAARDQVRLDCLSQSLEQADCLPVVIGCRRNGFELEDVRRTLDKHKAASTAILMAHGDVVGGSHAIMATPQTMVTARDFYGLVASARQKPITMFVESCAATDGCEEAIKVMPVGSTILTYAMMGGGSSYSLAHDAFALKRVAPYSVAETFHLNILCNGLHTKLADREYLPAHNAPHITVVTPQRDKAHNISDLWSHMCFEGMEVLNGRFSPANRRKVHKALAPFCDTARLEEAMDTAEHIFETCINPQTARSPRTRLGIELTLKQDDVMWDCAQLDLLGPMCAIDYVMWRKYYAPYKARKAPAHKAPVAE